MLDDIKSIIDTRRSNPPVAQVRRQTFLYPSSASIEWTDEHGVLRKHGACLRQQWYRFLRYPEDPGEVSARISRIRDLGDVISEMYVQDFKNAGIYVADEVSLFMDDIRVSGRFDIMIKDPYTAPKPPGAPEPKDMIGIEVKSIGGYHKIKGPILTTRDTPLKPIVEHVLQSMLYLHYYSQWGLTRWSLLYVNRENMDDRYHTLIFQPDGSIRIVNESGVFDWTHITIQGIKDRYRTLWKHIEDETIPPRDYDLQYSNTKICSMYARDEFLKTDKATVERGLRKVRKIKGIKEIQPISWNSDDIPLIVKGDQACQWCNFAKTCWSDTPDAKNEENKVAALKEQPKASEPQADADFV